VQKIIKLAHKRPNFMNLWTFTTGKPFKLWMTFRRFPIQLWLWLLFYEFLDPFPHWPFQQTCFPHCYLQFNLPFSAGNSDPNPNVIKMSTRVLSVHTFNVIICWKCYIVLRVPCSNISSLPIRFKVISMHELCPLRWVVALVGIYCWFGSKIGQWRNGVIIILWHLYWGCTLLSVM
jgi:hypothetical protein